ncbi:unnamed protein product [Arctogadus glacialis]
MSADGLGGPFSSQGSIKGLSRMEEEATREPACQDDACRHGTHHRDGNTDGSDLPCQGLDRPGRRDNSR